ncbi:MAG: hypothetical protein R3B84_24670 [Zavarzinella sp.]
MSNSPTLSFAEWQSVHKRLFDRWTIIFVWLGVVYRLVKYLVAAPIWGDEVMLCVNYIEKSYGDMFGPIDHSQIAPLLFHWAEIAAYQLLGSSEYAMRLPATLGSLAGLLLFWWLCRRHLPPLSGMIAVGVMAVSSWPATKGGTIKPYTWDLLFATAVVFLALEVFSRTRKTVPLLLLILLTPIAVASSYPWVFMAGGASLAIMYHLYVQRAPRALWVYWLIWNLVLLGSFLLHYHFVSQAHLSSSVADVNTKMSMQKYWRDQFPTGNALQILFWLVRMTTGELAAYPLGSQNGGSIFTVIVCGIGWWGLRQQRQFGYLLLLTVPFVLHILAAFLQKYPYGAARLSMHLAPVFCLLLGFGWLKIISTWVTAPHRLRFAYLNIIVLVLIGVGGTTLALVKTQREFDSGWYQSTWKETAQLVGDSPLIVVYPPSGIMPYDEWYIAHEIRHSTRFEQTPWAELAQNNDKIFIYWSQMSLDQTQLDDFMQKLRASHPQWAVAETRNMNKPQGAAAEPAKENWLVILSRK